MPYDVLVAQIELACIRVHPVAEYSLCYQKKWSSVSIIAMIKLIALTNNINLDKQAYGHTDSRAFSSMFSGSGTIAEPLKRGQIIPANEDSKTGKDMAALTIVQFNIVRHYHRGRC